MNSETSSDMKIEYLDNNGKKIDVTTEMKKQTSDTDFYFDIIANKEKIIIKDSESSESSDIKVRKSEDTESSKTSSKSSKSTSSKQRVETISIDNDINFSEERQKYNSKPVNLPNIPPVNTMFTSNIPQMDNFTNIQTLSPQEMRMKKIELLRRLCEIKAKGFQLTKEYDFNSSIEEMEYEYALLKSFADKRNGIKLYKSFLLNGVSLVEFMNDKYDPFDFKLSGWSDHMSVEVDSYDDVLEELYEKYKTTGGSWPPEVKLMMLIVGSGAGFHFTKTQFGNMPSISAGQFLNKMMKQDTKKSQFMSAQEVNIEEQKKKKKKKKKKK